MATINDGKTGRSVEVNTNNRLMVSAADVELIDSQTARGMSYTFGSGPINLTSASESAVLYIKNTDPVNVLVLDRFIITIGKSTGAVDGLSLKIFKNPTSGTLLSSGTPTTGGNRNYGSLISSQSDSKSGAEGLTLLPTASNFSTLFFPQESFTNLPAGFILPVGTSIGFSWTPSSGNTSVDVTTTVISYYIDPNNI